MARRRIRGDFYRGQSRRVRPGPPVGTSSRNREWTRNLKAKRECAQRPGEPLDKLTALSVRSHRKPSGQAGGSPPGARALTLVFYSCPFASIRGCRELVPTGQRHDDWRSPAPPQIGALGKLRAQ